MGKDIHFDNVVLLLHGDISDKTVIDHSNSKHIVSVAGDVLLSEDESKFSESSIFFDGVYNAAAPEGEHLTIPKTNDFDFASGDFTIETFIRLNSLNNMRIFSSASLSSPFYGIRFYVNSNGSVTADISTDGGASSNVSVTSNANVVQIDTWHHIALVRSGGDIFIFVDGSEIENAAISGDVYFDTRYEVYIGTDLATIGVPSLMPYFDGYISEYRITKGVARYTATFTPTTIAFGNYKNEVSASISESSNVEKWRVTLINHKGFKSHSGVFTGNTYALSGDISKPHFVVLAPEIDGGWSQNIEIPTDYIVTAADPVGNPHLWKCTTSGTTGGTEPSWNLSGTTNDNDVLWTYLAPLPEPVIEGPLIAL